MSNRQPEPPNFTIENHSIGFIDEAIVQIKRIQTRELDKLELSDLGNVGFCNGLEQALAILEDRTPEFIDAEKRVDIFPAIERLIKACEGRESEIPNVIRDIETRLLEHLEIKTEQAYEQAVDLRKVFDELLRELNTRRYPTDRSLLERIRQEDED